MINYIRFESPDEIEEHVKQIHESGDFKNIQIVTDYVRDLESFFSTMSKTSLAFWVNILKRSDFPENLKTELIGEIIKMY